MARLAASDEIKKAFERHDLSKLRPKTFRDLVAKCLEAGVEVDPDVGFRMRAIHGGYGPKEIIESRGRYLPGAEYLFNDD